MSFPSRALFRALTQGISRSTSTPKATNATSERYSAIRRFFKQWQPATTQNILGAYRQETTRNVVPLLQTPSFAITRQLARGFHTSPLQAKQQKPRIDSADTTPDPVVQPAKPVEKGAEPHVQPSPAPNRFDHYPQFFRRLALSVPNIHRPTRDDMLNAASGFWERTRIRFRWFTIKSFRKFNADDISAFITWFLMSQTLWILVGT